MTADVTFILPVRNGANFITEAIEAAKSQTYQNWKFLILDNCSTDNTVEVCQPYLKDPRFTLVKNEKNLGVVGNLRKGIAMTDTKYWCYLCHDDKFTDNTAIERAYAVLEKDKEEALAMVTSPMAWIDKSSNQIACFREQFEGRVPSNKVAKACIITCRDPFGMIMLARTKFVKTWREVTEPSVLPIADIDLFTHIGWDRDVYIFEKSAYAIRFHPSNNSMRTYTDTKMGMNAIKDYYKITLTPFEKLRQAWCNFKVKNLKRVFYFYIDNIRRYPPDNI